MVTPSAGAAVMKQTSSLGMSSKPTSGHVQPSGKIEKPGPGVKVWVVLLAVLLLVDVIVALVMLLPVVVVWLLPVVLEEDTVLVYMPGQMYRKLGFADVSEPVDVE